MEKSPILEAVKEAGRYAIFIGISAFVSFLTSKLTEMPQNDIMIVALTVVLRTFDKYLHERNKKKGYATKPNGLLPF